MYALRATASVRDQVDVRQLVIEDGAKPDVLLDRATPTTARDAFSGYDRGRDRIEACGEVSHMPLRRRVAAAVELTRGGGGSRTVENVS